MKQLSGMDASFLYMETATTVGHVSGLGIFQLPDQPGWSPYEAMREKLARSIGDVEPMRRRLVEVPFGLDHPYWIDDPDFDLEFHVRNTAVPPPGRDDQLANLVARLVARAMDRAHPLWEAYVIEGLRDDRFAVLVKVHHATIDGAAGAELIKIFYDAEPSDVGTGTGDRADGEAAPRRERVPSPAQVLATVVRDAAFKPGKFLRLQVRAARAVGELTRNRGLTGLADLARVIPNPVGAQVAARSERDADRAPPPPENAAPSTPFNGAISSHRRVALRSVDLGEIKAVKNATSTTVNDVVMAVCAGALRNYLLDHQALPASPLVAMVPVSIRTGEESDPWTNRVSAMFPLLPTTEAEPIERLRLAQQIMLDAKGRFSLVPADVLTEYADFAPPALAIRAARMASRLRLADRVGPPFNLVISNVPGPRHPLWLGPAQLLHYFPVSTITESQGLNITVQSYCDKMDFGLVSARELVPDLEDLADHIVAEVAVLAKAAAELGGERAHRKTRA
ncbi:MAG: WS/DGAT/MGAT family O-acyltransferase [Acidimicrobiales bacterium]